MFSHTLNPKSCAHILFISNDILARLTAKHILKIAGAGVSK